MEERSDNRKKRDLNISFSTSVKWETRVSLCFSFIITYPELKVVQILEVTRRSAIEISRKGTTAMRSELSSS